MDHDGRQLSSGSDGEISYDVKGVEGSTIVQKSKKVEPPTNSKFAYLTPV